MPLPRPDYLAYTVPCPLNAGKLARVVDFVNHWRGLAKREAAWQWRHLHAQVAAFQAAHPGVSRASSCRGKPLARGRRADPRVGNPYFSAVLEAALKAGQPTPTIGVCSV